MPHESERAAWPHTRLCERHPRMIYSYAGSRFASAIALELPSFQSDADGVGAPDVTVSREPPSTTPRPGYEYYAVNARQGSREVALGRVDGHWVAWLPPYLTAHMSATHIHVSPFPGVSDDVLNEHIVANLLPMWLVVAGRWAFHAAVMAHSEYGCVAVCGAGGAGKSTSAAALAASGWWMVADDTATGRFEGGRVMFDLTAHTLHLRGHAQRLAGEIAEPPHGTDPQGRVVINVAHATGPVALDRLLFVSHGAGPLTPLPPSVVLKELLENSRIAAWADPELRAIEFEAAADIAARVPGYSVETPAACRTLDEFALYADTLIAESPSGK